VLTRTVSGLTIKTTVVTGHACGRFDHNQRCAWGAGAADAGLKLIFGVLGEVDQIDENLQPSAERVWLPTGLRF
jgi:hypothetical protein